MKIAIIGGGISGLSAAWELERARRAGAPVEYHLFEAAAHTGGILKSECAGDFLIEHGADSFLTQKTAARELCRELGIEHALIGSNDATRKTYLFVNEKLVPLPEPLNFVVPASATVANWEFFSDSTRAQFAKERELRPSGVPKQDESAANFVRSHFGPEVVALLAAPMLAGIYGGDAERLSARAVMPRLVELENEQGSLLRAFEASRSATSSPIFTSLKDGMGQMAAAIVARLGAGRLVKDCLVKEIESDGHWHIVIDNRRRQFDSVIVALPAHAAAKLLQQAAPELSRELAQIEYSSSAVVSLAYEKAHDLKIPSGFGFLVPRNQSCRLMACTFAHQKFSGRAPQGAALLRAFFGGVHDPQVIDLEDRELIAVARADLRRILGIAAEPLFMRVQRWPHAMPQYNVGHLERVARIESLLTNFSGLKLAGSAYRGIGIPDCIASARAAARELLTAANFSSANLSHATGN